MSGLRKQFSADNLGGFSGAPLDVDLHLLQIIFLSFFSGSWTMFLEADNHWVWGYFTTRGELAKWVFLRHPDFVDENTVPHTRALCLKLDDHYNDVIMTTIASHIPASRLFTQPFIQTQLKENIQAPRHWPLCGEFTATGEFPAQRASYAENVSIWWRHHGPRIGDSQPSYSSSHKLYCGSVRQHRHRHHPRIYNLTKINLGSSLNAV